MEDIEKKLDSMSPEEQAKFMSDLKDGGEGYVEDEPPALETETEGAEPEGTEPVEKEKEWAGEAEEPPAEGQEPPEGDELDEFLSLDINSIPEEHREKFQKARDKVQRAIERAKEKERGADKKFREAADMRKQPEAPPPTPPKPKEPWYVKHGLKAEDEKVFEDWFAEKVAPILRPFLEDQLATREDFTLKEMENEFTEEKGYPEFKKYKEDVKRLTKEVPALTYEEAYKILAFKDVKDRTSNITQKQTKETILRRDQSRREKEHFFEDSTPRQGQTGKVAEPKQWNPKTIRQHMDALKEKDPSGKLLTAFMATLDDGKRR